MGTFPLHRSDDQAQRREDAMLGEEIDRAHFAFSEMGLVAIKEMGDDAVVAGMATTRATITIDQHEPRG